MSQEHLVMSDVPIKTPGKQIGASRGGEELSNRVEGLVVPRVGQIITQKSQHFQKYTLKRGRLKAGAGRAGKPPQQLKALRSRAYLDDVEPPDLVKK